MRISPMDDYLDNNVGLNRKKNKQKGFTNTGEDGRGSVILSSRVNDQNPSSKSPRKGSESCFEISSPSLLCMNVQML